MSKAEVSGWPGISTLAKVTGTLFIHRDRRAAAGQVALFRERLAAGNRLLFFPEGTSTDGRRTLPFKTTLFAAFFDPELHAQMTLQPVTVIYHAPKGERADFYGWWGNMDFGVNLLQILAAPRQGSVEVTYHLPLRVADFPDRKLLALHCETVVRGRMTEVIGKPEND